MFENEGAQEARRQDDPRITRWLNNNQNGVQFKSKITQIFCKIFEGIFCLIISMWPGFTVDRYINLVYHDFFKSFFLKVMHEEPDQEKDGELNNLVNETELQETNNKEENIDNPEKGNNNNNNENNQTWQKVRKSILISS